MPSVCIATPTLLMASGNAAHLWIFINWALGLRDAGVEVSWMEVSSEASGHVRSNKLTAAVDRLRERLAPYDLHRTVSVVSALTGDVLVEQERHDRRAADVLLNFNYGLSPLLVSRWPTSVLMDIDPGLLQTWWSRGEVRVAPHDLYFTIGETVGSSSARFPTCGVSWQYTSPPVHLPSWPVVAAAPPHSRYTTVTGWWDEWMELAGETFSNEKRSVFLEYLDLPGQSGCDLELAIIVDPLTAEQDVPVLERHGWAVTEAQQVCETPSSFAQYVRRSRGEFSCSRPSSRRLQSTWIGDRALCYLASGLPVIAEHTAASRYEFGDTGYLRYSSMAEAAAALRRVEVDREAHCRHARAIAEEHFDAKMVAASILDRVL